MSEKRTFILQPEPHPSRRLALEAVREQDKARFWVKVDKSGPNGCWIWTAYRNPMGYGTFGLGGRKGRMFLAHRVAYTILVGDIEDGFDLDHICHNPACVNPTHLRVCSRAENARNTKLRKNNKSGLKGVYWFPRDSNWVAQICVNRKRKHLGYFDTPEAAYAAYCKAATDLHGAFANFGEVA